MKTIVTWIGFNEDFLPLKDELIQINALGFTNSIHKDIYDQYHFKQHLILTTTDKSGQLSPFLEQKKKMLQSFLKGFYPKHTIEFLETGIDKSDLQNFPIIESQLRSFLQSRDPSEDIHVIAGTGPTAVGMAWCTLSLSMEKRLSLHVMQLPMYAPGGKVSTLKEIRPTLNKLLDDKLREYHFNEDLPSDIYIDEIVNREYAKARALASAIDINILILGETGCGKDRLAEDIVKRSPLNSSKYKPINCASLPDDLLYSELFGHVKGAFTGANHDRTGLFEECNGGTLFLDEIGDMSKFMQQSLLRAIENKQIKRLGSNEIIKDVKVRIIAATNNDLYEKCKKGDFRWDLYYRLGSTIEIELQPYRSRTVDGRNRVLDYYLKKNETRWKRKINITTGATKIISQYNFPGNFREISSFVNGLFALGEPTITEAMLPKRFMDIEANLDESYETVLKLHCIAMYNKYKFDIAATCKALGYKNSTQLKNKLIEWGVFT